MQSETISRLAFLSSIAALLVLFLLLVSGSSAILASSYHSVSEDDFSEDLNGWYSTEIDVPYGVGINLMISSKDGESTEFDMEIKDSENIGIFDEDDLSTPYTNFVSVDISGEHEVRIKVPEGTDITDLDIIISTTEEENLVYAVMSICLLPFWIGLLIVSFILAGFAIFMRNRKRSEGRISNRYRKIGMGDPRISGSESNWNRPIHDKRGVR